MSFCENGRAKDQSVSRTSYRCIASRIKRNQALVLLIAALATLGACAPLAEVREVNPTLGAPHGTLPQLHRAEQAIADAENFKRSDPKRAVGLYLAGVESATRELRRDPKDRLAVRDYDFGLSRVFSVIRDTHLDPWTHPLHLPAPDGAEYVLSQRPAANRLWKPQYFDLIPADELDVRGKFVVPRVTRTGAGASLVAVRNEQAPEIRQRFVPPRIYFAVSAVAHFSGRNCEVEFIDPLATETTNVSGRTMPTAADFTAPIAVALSREHPEKIGVPAMLDPDKFADKARLIQIQPYDPKKIPVLFVHGLQATPVTWVPMVNAIWADPAVRRNYQVWVFNYPTGYPIPYSALVLRRQLEALDKAFPNHRPIVLVGHSMGGILSRLMITDSRGDKVWRYFFGTSPAQTAVSPDAKALLKEALIFKPRRDVARVIFISTPHHGSMIAQTPIGRIASSLIHRPLEFVRLGSEIMHASVVKNDPGLMRLKRMPNSIDTLAPNDAFVKIMNTLPLAKGVPYHSIIGDRGRGDTPNSSDGVVPYWSSHVSGAKSEKIVPSDHGANQNAEGIAEVIRILKEHSGSKSTFSNREARAKIFSRASCCEYSRCNVSPACELAYVRANRHHGVDSPIDGPPFLMAEAGHQINGLPRDNQLLGNYKLGCWYDDAVFTNFNTGARTHGSWGFYGSLRSGVSSIWYSRQQRGLGLFGSVTRAGSVSIGNLRLKLFRNVFLQTREIKLSRNNHETPETATNARWH